MHHTIKSILLIVTLSGFSLTTTASEPVHPPSHKLEVSGNLGFMSEYYYRGILQKTSSASAGLDIAYGNIAAGVWLADVGDGLETDIFSSYSHAFTDDFSTSIGFTGYYYSGNFDETYEEVNLSVSYRFIALDYAEGSWAGIETGDDRYSFLSITFTGENLYATYGQFGKIFDGHYIELGASHSFNELDVNLALIVSSDELSDQLNTSGEATDSEALVFTLSKSFDL